MRFVGIDLAWSPRNRSGGAVLALDGKLARATATLGSDDEILDFITTAIPDGTPGLIAVDAPLAVPNETGSRPCDRQVASVFGRYEAAPYPANRRNLARYGGLRAEAIRLRLQSLGFRHDPYVTAQAPTRQIVEVFPHPATISLFNLNRTLKYKARSGRDYEHRWQALSQLRDHLAALADADPPLFLPRHLARMPIKDQRGRAFKEREDLLDAVVCAYSARFAWHHGPRRYAVYGPRGLRSGSSQGHILVPISPTMWERIKRPRLLFLDRDGTLNQSFGDRPPNRPEEVKLLPGIAATLHWYASQGWRLVIVTNQGGVAFGYLSESQAQVVHQAVLDALPVDIDASYLCPHHPQGTIPQFAVHCPNRKPAPGAILDALDRYAASPADCLFVGDQESDLQAAVAVGVPFRWAADWAAG